MHKINNMTKPFFFFTIIVIFSTVSIIHFLRLTFELEVFIGSWSVPGWFSGLIVLFTAFMAYWALKLNQKDKKSEKEEKDHE